MVVAPTTRIRTSTSSSTCSSSPAGTRSRPSRSSPCSTPCRASDGPGATAPAAGHDVVVFYDLPGLRFTRSDPPVELIEPSAHQRAVIDELCAGGTGLVFLHHAVAGWPAWPEYAELIGGRFHYQPASDGRRRLPGLGLPVRRDPHGRGAGPRAPGVRRAGRVVHADRRALLLPRADRRRVVRCMRTTFDTSDVVAVLLRRPRHPGPAREQRRLAPPTRAATSSAWVKQAGTSPVVYLQFGDGPVTYADPSFRRVLANAIAWVASRRRTGSA